MSVWVMGALKEGNVSFFSHSRIFSFTLPSFRTKKGVVLQQGCAWCSTPGSQCLQHVHVYVRDVGAHLSARSREKQLNHDVGITKSIKNLKYNLKCTATCVGVEPTSLLQNLHLQICFCRLQTGLVAKYQAAYRERRARGVRSNCMIKVSRNIYIMPTLGCVQAWESYGNGVRTCHRFPEPLSQQTHFAEATVARRSLYATAFFSSHKKPFCSSKIHQNRRKKIELLEKIPFTVGTVISRFQREYFISLYCGLLKCIAIIYTHASRSVWMLEILLNARFTLKMRHTQWFKSFFLKKRRVQLQRALRISSIFCGFILSPFILFPVSFLKT